MYKYISIVIFEYCLIYLDPISHPESYINSESGQLRLNYNQQPQPVHPSQKDNSNTMLQADVSPSPPNYGRNHPSCEVYIFIYVC